MESIRVTLRVPRELYKRIAEICVAEYWIPPSQSLVDLKMVQLLQSIVFTGEEQAEIAQQLSTDTEDFVAAVASEFEQRSSLMESLLKELYGQKEEDQEPEEKALRPPKKKPERRDVSPPTRERAGHTTNTWKIWSYVIRYSTDRKKWHSFTAESIAQAVQIRTKQAESACNSLITSGWIYVDQGQYHFTRAGKAWYNRPGSQRFLVEQDVLQVVAKPFEETEIALPE